MEFEYITTFSKIRFSPLSPTTENIKIDDTILYCEFLELMDERIAQCEPKIHGKPDFSLRVFTDVENDFLRLFTSLMGNTKRENYNLPQSTGHAPKKRLV